jgi:hypothetical protein
MRAIVLEKFGGLDSLASSINREAPAVLLEDILRRFRAKLGKKIVDSQAANPSSWKMPFNATCIVW